MTRATSDFLNRRRRSEEEVRAAHDPFTNENVKISNALVDRLRGRYACGPTLPNGKPEFGWRQYATAPIQVEAAERIEEQAGHIAALVEAVKDTADTLEGYFSDGTHVDSAQWISDLRSLVAKAEGTTP